MTLVDDLVEVGRVAASIDEFGTREGLPRRTILDVQLALEEVLTNVISYAFDGIDERAIDVEWSMDDCRIQLRVTDNGQPFNPLLQEDSDTGKSAEDRRIGGLGIFLARKMMDGMQYSRQDNRNVLILWKTWR